jgi:hypothetical protein
LFSQKFLRKYVKERSKCAEQLKEISCFAAKLFSFAKILQKEKELCDLRENFPEN